MEKRPSQLCLQVVIYILTQYNPRCSNMISFMQLTRHQYRIEYAKIEQKIIEQRQIISRTNAKKSNGRSRTKKAGSGETKEEEGKFHQKANT